MSYYVVWYGHSPGIYKQWNDCRKQVEGFPDPQYKRFESYDEAYNAYRKGCQRKSKFADTVHIGTRGYRAAGRGGNRKKKEPKAPGSPAAPKFERNSLLVYTRTSGENMTILATYLKNNQQVFKVDFQRGNPEIGQFLATVKALKLLRKGNPTVPVYVESLKVINAIEKKFLYDRYLGQRELHDPWHKELRNCMQAAVRWLKRNPYHNPVLHWNSAYWGECPK